jgi:protein-L-isoaspartate(D-aspartate) O-methyltransferase
MGFLGIFLGFLVFGNNAERYMGINTNQDIVQEINQQDSSIEVYKEVIPDVFMFDITSRSSHPPLENKTNYINWMLANTKEKEKYIKWRWECVQDIVGWKSLSEPRVIEAFLRTPRENFIRARNVNRAYEHAYMEIGYGATITDPWIVAVMTQAINPKPEQKVLEIGTGSGYQSAILSELTNYVYSIEIIEALAKETEEIYNSNEEDYPEYKNIKRTIGDGYYGWEEHAPFDRIIVTCSIDHIPPLLLKQLKPEGIMVIPVGPPSGQKLLKVTKHVEADIIYFDRENLVPKTVRFISFLNKEGKSYSIDKQK